MEGKQCEGKRQKSEQRDRGMEEQGNGGMGEWENGEGRGAEEWRRWRAVM